MNIETQREMHIEARKANKAVALLFLMVLFVVFTVAAIVTFPKAKIVDISETIPVADKNLYRLSEGSYEVLGEVGEQTATDSTFLTPITYNYFTIMVENGLVMTVRTRDKTELLRSGQAPALCGMVSEINEPSKQMCLYDNDTNRYCKSIGFFILIFVDALLIVRVMRRRIF